MKNPKILILTASYGTGHVIVAKALDEAFRKKGIEPTVIDLVEVGGKTEQMGKSFYSFLMKRGHFIWKFYHEKIMPINRGDSIRSIYKFLNKGNFFKDIEKINPDIIISTMDQASVIVSLFKEDHPEVKIATVLTDYVIHPIWTWKNMDYYFCGSNEIQKYLEKHGIDKNRIYKTGIPLRSQFDNLQNKKEARKTLGIPDDGRTVLLLSAGSFGSVPVAKILEILKERQDIFVTIIAGDKAKVPEYADLLRVHDLVGKVVEYTDQMEVFMVASDLFLSKAGGVTTAECLRCALPAVYVNNFPGHEAGNAEYTERHGASRNVKNKKDMEKVLLELVNNKEMLSEMSKNAQKLSFPHASPNIVKTLL